MKIEPTRSGESHERSGRRSRVDGVVQQSMYMKDFPMKDRLSNQGDALRLRQSSRRWWYGGSGDRWGRNHHSKDL